MPRAEVSTRIPVRFHVPGDTDIELRMVNIGVGNTASSPSIEPVKACPATPSRRWCDEKAMRVIWKQDVKAGIFGDPVNGSPVRDDDLGGKNVGIQL